MIVITDTILIAASPDIVFAALLDPSTLQARSRDTDGIHVDPEARLNQGSTFQRILYTHGLPHRQVIRVVAVDAPRVFSTQTTLLGYTVEYRYLLVPSRHEQTLLTLTKRASGGWRLWRPLVHHLLTRPEHDRDHAQRIGELAEHRARLTKTSPSVNGP